MSEVRGGIFLMLPDMKLSESKDIVTWHKLSRFIVLGLLGEQISRVMWKTQDNAYDETKYRYEEGFGCDFVVEE